MTIVRVNQAMARKRFTLVGPNSLKKLADDNYEIYWVDNAANKHLFKINQEKHLALMLI